MTTPDLAAFSDNLAASSIAVLALALLSHAVELALRVRSARTPTPALVAPRAGSPAHADTVHPKSEAVRSDDDAGSRAARIGTSLTVLGVVLVTAATLARGIAAGRAPWANMYEFALSGAAAVGISYLLTLRRAPVRALGIWIVGLLLLLLGLGITVLYTPVDGLVPVLNSYWLVIHVAAAIVAGALFTVGVVATVAHLVLARVAAGRNGATATRERAATYDAVAHGAHLVAFPIWTFAVLAGAIWAENAWGRYWGWDPKETWAFITWVFYAAYLHAQATPGRWGRASGWLAVAGFASFVFNFFGVNIWLPGLHSYAGV